MGFWTFFGGKTSSPELVRNPIPWGFCQNTAKSMQRGGNNYWRYFGFDPIPKPCAQTELIAPQNQELLAWLGLKFCFPLIPLDAFFCSHSLRILIIFVRYKISASATEGLVQQRFGAIGVLGKLLSWFCTWKLVFKSIHLAYQIPNWRQATRR